MFLERVSQWHSGDLGVLTLRVAAPRAWRELLTVMDLSVVLEDS